jgi:uncharacterized membrane protein YeaQ/YmgE (transglycosylase-associated protein family)
MTHSPVDQFIPSDASIGQFLAARRKLIIGLLAIAGVLVSGQLDAGLVVQAIIGFIGAYGIHEVAND